jgi:hypothetical protein
VLFCVLAVVHMQFAWRCRLHTHTSLTLLSLSLCGFVPPPYGPTTNHRLQLGLNGAAYAFVLSQATSCLLLIAYTAWRDTRMAAAADPQATWSRPSMAVFAGWGTYLSYGVPACLMICMEWWCYEVLILLAGALLLVLLLLLLTVHHVVGRRRVYVSLARVLCLQQAGGWCVAAVASFLWSARCEQLLPVDAECWLICLLCRCHRQC